MGAFRFFREHKPFLRPGYKMTDLVEDLDVNRTVLSAFINQTYGMNFNRYLNRFRLRELDRLRSHPANQGKSVSSLRWCTTSSDDNGVLFSGRDYVVAALADGSELIAFEH